MAKKPKKPQKRILTTLELTTLLVALDHLEEYGPDMSVPDAYEKPGECVYLKFIGEAHLKALTDRVPHLDVRFNLPGNSGERNPIRAVFSKAAILHVLQFCFPQSNEYRPFVRDLKSVDERYWRVLGSDGKPIKRPPKDKDKAKSKR
jgi:hypothetical protein